VHVAANQHVRELKLSEGAKSHTFQERMHQRLQKDKGMLGEYRKFNNIVIFEIFRQPASDGWGSNPMDSEARAQAIAAVCSVMAMCR
jgi:hypothetical protein